MTAVISKIISMQHSLTVIENEIAQYVMDYSEDVVNSTITTFAKNTNTSEASINRFCKKLGFKGFNSFKIALAQGTYYSNLKERSEPENAALSITSSISRDYHQMILSTSAMIDEDVVIQAAAFMKNARRIYIFSAAVTVFAAMELELKLNMVGLNAKSVTEPNSMRMFASGVREDDLVAVLAPSILMSDIYQAVNVCKDRGAKILSITSYDSPKLESLVDFKFVTSDKIIARNALSLSNSPMFMYVVDVLYSALLSADKDLRQRKLNSDALLSSSQVINNYLLEY